MKVENLIQENDKRLKVRQSEYNPYTGKGAPLKRAKLVIKDYYLPVQFVPEAMMGEQLVQQLIKHGSIREFVLSLGEPYTAANREVVVNSLIKVRNRYDFFYWAASLAKIKNKYGGDNIPFVLNRPQLKLIAECERMRLAGVPIRIIILKARQWGGSTAVQIYMAWIQLVHREGWYSSIVAQDNNTSRKIKAMYSKLLEEYPPQMLDLPEGAPIEFGSYEGSTNDFIIKQAGKVVRDSVVSVGSVQSPNSIRGGDIAMAHFSEVGVWKSTTEWNASNIISSVAGAILNEPLTMIAYESTAKGTGDFFHTEWLRANKTKSDPDYSGFTPVFVSWFEIELYTKAFDSDEQRREFAAWLLTNKDSDKAVDAPDAGKYYWKLWNLGATLENLNWYVMKRREFADHSDMASEFPSDAIEAFKHSGDQTFDVYKLDALRKACALPDYVGEIAGNAVDGPDALKGVRFVADDKKGSLSIWEMPDTEQKISNRYLVIVDPQKGASKGADYSDILVLDRYWLMHGGGEVVVAEWHGHIDKDLLAWKSAQIATFYNNAHLVIERNTYDQEKRKQMDEAEFIIDEIYEYYDNMYIYTPMGKTTERETKNVGFFTNRGTKPAIVNNLIRVVRDLGYVERSAPAIDEMTVYERKEDGNWGAMEKHNDDRVITRAIGLWVSQKMDLPSEDKGHTYQRAIVKQVKYR